MATARSWVTDSALVYISRGVVGSFQRRLPKLPFIVKARFVSKIAEAKIKEAGGVVKLIA